MALLTDSCEDISALASALIAKRRPLLDHLIQEVLRIFPGPLNTSAVPSPSYLPHRHSPHRFVLRWRLRTMKPGSSPHSPSHKALGVGRAGVFNLVSITAPLHAALGHRFGSNAGKSSDRYPYRDKSLPIAPAMRLERRTGRRPDRLRTDNRQRA
jgi:hypothetical protein